MSKYRTSVSIDEEHFFWVVVDQGKFVRNPTKEDLIETKLRYYNPTNICPKCREENRITDNSILRSGNAKRECNEKGDWSGRWLCERHNSIRRQKLPDSRHNLLKSLANRRTGNLKDPSAIFGDNILKLACILYEWEDLNEKYDNYEVPIDCYDPKTGFYYQVRGKRYYFESRFWSFGNFEREWKKKYRTMICFCISEDGQTVERIYKFPFEEEIKEKRKGVGIVKYDSTGQLYNCGWYERYREINKDELKRANKIWKGIIESIKDKIKKR